MTMQVPFQLLKAGHNIQRHSLEAYMLLIKYETVSGEPDPCEQQ
jgi:hypothetical protein